MYLFLFEMDNYNFVGCPFLNSKFSRFTSIGVGFVLKCCVVFHQVTAFSFSCCLVYLLRSYVLSTEVTLSSQAPVVLDCEYTLCCVMFFLDCWRYLT